MPELGMFLETGVLLRAPGGNVENIAHQKPVVRWAALNVGGEVGRDPSRWDRQRALYAEAGIVTLPWLHCHKVEDVDFLVSVGKAWTTRAIGPNIEDVVTDKLDLAQVAERLKSWPGEILMPTLPWVQNGQGWANVARCVAALEIFPDENDASKKVQDCIDHAFAEGFTKVTLMYKTKPPNQPQHYDLSLSHSFYTGDDITPTQEAWAAWIHPGKERPPMPTTATTTPMKKKKSAKASGDPNWHTKPYPKNADPPDIPLPRAVFPPDARQLKKTPSSHGADVLAYKRAIARAQRWAWAPTVWDDAYSNAFAHGKAGAGVDESGVAGFQQQMGIKDTGWMGEATFEALRTSLVPDKPGSSHAGEPLFDSVCLQLLRQAAKDFAKPSAGIDDIRAAIIDFLQKAEANEANWHYSQNRPVMLDVDPSGKSITSDCSGIVIQAYRFALKTTGLPVPDPAKQNWTGFGNTDLDEDGHPKVTDGNYQVGDLAHYQHHVTICRKAGDASSAVWTSHGQESGPDPVTLHYRSDFRFVVRPPLIDSNV